MPPARKPRDGACVAAVKRDLATLPDDLAKSSLAASALVMAQGLDNPGNSLTSKSMAQARLQDVMDRLRELAPPVATRDGVDGLADDLTARRARIAKGSARAKNS